MPIGAELVILGSLLYVLYLMTRSDPNWVARGRCGRCARCEEEQKAAEYQQTGDRVGYLTRHLMTCPKCGSKRCPKAADHRNTCQKEPNP